MKYYFIRLKWASTLDMSKALNDRLLDNERVIGMTSDRNEVTLLVERS